MYDVLQSVRELPDQKVVMENPKKREEKEIESRKCARKSVVPRLFNSW